MFRLIEPSSGQIQTIVLVHSVSAHIWDPILLTKQPVINNSERGLSYNSKKILANRSLQLKIWPTSDDISYNHKQHHL